MLRKMTELKPRIENILIFSVSLLISVGLLIYILVNFIESPENLKNTEAIIFVVLLTIFFFPPLILSVTYFYIDLTKKVYVDESTKKIIIHKRGRETIIRQDDILDSFYVRVEDKWRYKGYYFPMYKYIVLILKERKRVFITNLLCDPELIIGTLNLNPKIIYTNVPFINNSLGSGVLTTKEFESRVLEFETSFQEHSNSKLAEIISQRNVYADYAREAATRILNKRKH
jgi:hypothetical protein